MRRRKEIDNKPENDDFEAFFDININSDKGNRFSGKFYVENDAL